MKPEMMFAYRQEKKREAEAAAQANQPAGAEQKESAPSETKVIYPAETKRIKRKPRSKARRGK